MHFDRVYLTSNGYAALGAVTAGSTASSTNPSKIIWGEAYTSSVDITDGSVWTQARINSATKSDFPSSTYTSRGSVTEVSTGLYPPSAQTQYETATLTIEVTNGSESGGTYQYSGNACTLCVLGKKEGDADYELLIVASCDSPTVVSSVEPFKAILNCHIQLSQDVISAVTAADNWYAPAAAFNNLKNRVVTTHIEGNDSVGENQSIRGVKTFLDNTVHSSSILTTSSTCDIGSNATRWGTVYATTFNGTATNATNTTNASKVGILGSNSNSIYPLVFAESVNSSTTTASNKLLYTDTANSLYYNPNSNTFTIKTGTTDAGDILYTNSNTNSCYVKTKYTNSTSSTVSNFITLYYVHDSLKVLTTTQATTDSSYNLTSFVTRANVQDIWEIGSDSFKLKAVWANTFYGSLTESTPHNLHGIVVDGSTGPFYNGTCTNSGASRTVVCSGFTLATGAIITVLFTSANSSSSSVSLNVNSTGSKQIIAGSDVKTWEDNSFKTFKYNGTNWVAVKLNTVSNYGVCSDNAETSTKSVTLNNTSFVLTTGAKVVVKFSNTNTANMPKLNVNNTGAKYIKMYNGASPGNTAFESWIAGSVFELIYDGSYWHILGSQYYVPSASKVQISGTNSSSSCPLVFVGSVNTSTSDRVERVLYTDTANSLYYNPNTNTLSCPTFSGSFSGNATSSSYASYTSTVKYNSSATKSFYVNSSAELLCQGTVRPHSDYNGSINLGSSSYHWGSAYINNLYVGTDTTSLQNYINDRVDNRVSNTSYSYEGGVDVERGYISTGGLFIASSITIHYGFFGNSENWYSSRSNLHICRAEEIICSNSDSNFVQIPNDYGILLVRIATITFPFTNYYYTGTYRILSDLRWSDSGAQPSQSSANRSYTFTGIVLCQYLG